MNESTSGENVSVVRGQKDSGSKTGSQGMSERPKVTLVTTWLPTPMAAVSGVFVERDIRAISRVCDLRVVHLVAPQVDDGSRRASIGSVPVIRIPFAPSRGTWYLRSVPALRAALQDADLVHSVAVSSLLPVKMAGPRVPWVHTEHWSVFAESSQGVRGLVTRLLSQMELWPDRTVAVSADLASRLSRYTGREITVVENIVDVGSPRPRPVRVGQRPLKIVGVGGLVERKRPLLAVDTCAELNRRGVQVALEWVGDGPLRDQMTIRAARMGVSLEQTGALSPEATIDRMADSDLLLVPTAGETFMLVAAEALSLGRPVVVGANGGQRAFVSGPAGKLVDANDPSSYADAVMAVMKDTVGMTASQIADPIRNRFSPGKLADAYLQIYDSVG